ncbi:hypothetical protein BDP81DRAFT_418745 [Colletotrichum phormii]|uniref:Uncharacterized protein n=1 Tax=Colletotrichum phormii TaxID=359342 RepID=A0AAJ0EJD7_9PEZI|nr:uncharacterized protein BDP81DRAFT_418745 [Colletotrichum phormii]KAK1641363.1 hypothetical protein BDP81DRAFT_418745 [Colletotrichum phormii]
MESNQQLGTGGLTDGAVGNLSNSAVQAMGLVETSCYSGVRNGAGDAGTFHRVEWQVFRLSGALRLGNAELGILLNRIVGAGRWRVREANGTWFIMLPRNVDKSDALRHGLREADSKFKWWCHCGK